MAQKNTVLKHIRRSPYQSFAAIFMTSVTFYIVSVFALVVIGAHSMLAFFESRPQVTAFFKDDTTTAQVETLKSDINQMVAVEAMQYLSKEDALAIYRNQNTDNPCSSRWSPPIFCPLALKYRPKTSTTWSQSRA